MTIECASNGKAAKARGECELDRRPVSYVHPAEPAHLRPYREGKQVRSRPGFTLIELAIVVAIMGILATIAIPNYVRLLTNARVTQAIGDIRAIEKDLSAFEAGNDALPQSLAEIDRGAMLDPWGNTYYYLNFEGVGKGKMRKDRFMVPINSTYDLYSSGKDGETKLPLTAKASHDDVIRAMDGGFVGLASKY